MVALKIEQIYEEVNALKITIPKNSVKDFRDFSFKVNQKETKKDYYIVSEGEFTFTYLILLNSKEKIKSVQVLQKKKVHSAYKHKETYKIYYLSEYGELLGKNSPIIDKLEPHYVEVEGFEEVLSNRRAMFIGKTTNQIIYDSEN